MSTFICKRCGLHVSYGKHVSDPFACVSALRSELLSRDERVEQLEAVAAQVEPLERRVKELESRLQAMVEVREMRRTR